MTDKARFPLKSVLLAMLVAAAATSSGTLAQVLPPAGQCAPIGTLNCFDPTAQGEMWRTLAQIAERMRPNLQEPGEDHPGQPEEAVFGDGDEPDTDSVGAEIWYSTAESLEDAFAQLDPGECTFSHLGDDISLPRQCKAADGTMVPPPAGRLFYPSGVAADGTTIYVADRMNHRIATMRFDGSAFDIAHPIGNGAPGDGTYGLPGDEFVYANGVSGSQLNTPNGVAVDAAHRVLVADGGNGRVAIFNPDGTPAFASHLAIPPGIDGSDATPTNVALSPGAVVTPGSAPSGAAANHRLVVVDRYTCAIHIYDTALTHLRTLPENMPPTPGEGACVSEGSVPTPVGQFSLVSGTAVDRDGNIFVSDAWNNRVVVFNRDGDLVGQFGDPGPIAPGAQPPADTLRTPSALIVDSRDRVVVADSDNVRLAFFTVAVGDTVAATFQFEVATSGDEVEGVPTGIAEQRGPAPDLDPAGRYLRVDTGNHQLQRYELADLAIVRDAVSYTTNTTGSGVFSVAVPVEKEGAVLSVTADVEPPPGVTVSNFRMLPPFNQDPAAGIDIPRGTWVQYAFDFEVPVPRMAAEFTITAAGNKESGQATEADPVALLVRGACATCDAVARVYDYPAPEGGDPSESTLHNTPNGGWYARRVFVRLEPIDSDPPTEFIEWSVSGTELPIYGPGTRVAELTEDAPYADVPFSTSASNITYRAVTGLNTVGPERTLDIKVDPDGPIVLFNFFQGSSSTFLTPPSGFNPTDGPAGTWWWRGNVTAAYTVSDEYSGTATPNGTVVVSGEGRNLSAPVTAVDYVGHTSTVHSNQADFGGQPVNIDRTGPVISAPANLVLVADGSGSATVPESFSGGATASDVLSGVQGSVTASGPPTVPVGTVVQWTFTATDWAGNISVVTRTVTATLAGNVAPDAVDDTASGLGPTALDIAVLANDTDANGDSLIISGVTQPSGGAAVGLVTIVGTTTARFAPAPGFAGTTTFTYTASDGHGGFDTATVTVTITPPVCNQGILNLHATGNQTSGTAGNIRTFSGAGVQVKASAWSRTKTTSGSWAKAFLGAFGNAGLGVTDTTEGKGSDDKHKVDNIGERLNFVLFEFSKPVTVSRAMLTFVGNDSDITVWIGTRTDPFNNHLTLNDAVLASLGAPLMSQASTRTDRWAAFNAGNVSGNVLIIAADVTDLTPDDEFKISRLELTCAAPNQPPTVTTSPQRHDEGAAVSVAIAAADADEDVLVYAATGLPPGLSIDHRTGVIAGTLGYTSAGTYAVTITVTDERGATASSAFAWTVVNKNRPPTAVNDTLKTAKNTAKTMSVIANDSDPDSDTFALVAVSTPAGFKGTVVMNANGTVKYTPPKNFTGTTSFTYTIKDAFGATATAIVSVTVGSHRDDDDCDRDHDHDGDRDRDDDRERDCDRDHRHDRDCERNHDHDGDCDRDHRWDSRCNDNAGWYNWRYR